MAEQKSRVPRLVAGVDLRSLPLSPLEGFVLSRVDGSASVGDIADLTSLELVMVLATVEKLVALDAVEWADGATGLPKPSVRPPPPSAASVRAPSPERASRSFGPPPSRVAQQDLGVPASAMAPPRAPTVDLPPLEMAAEPRPAPPSSVVVPPPPLAALEMAPEQAPLAMTPPPGRSHSEPTPKPASAPPASSHAPSASSHAPRERAAGMHVYSARHGSEPPLVETFESHPHHERPHHERPHHERPHREGHASPAPGARHTPHPGAHSQVHAPHSHAAHSHAAQGAREHAQGHGGPTASRGPSARPPSGSQQPSVRPPTLTRASVRPSSSPVSPSGSGAPPKAPSAPAPPASAAAPAVPAAPTAPEEIDLPEEKRKKIDELYVIVDLLDHYQVLGIARDADRARVKSAYFELSKQFHPDTAFRKNVGPYRSKMEVIFKRLTEAYDVLSKKKAREEYDAYLARSEQSQELEQTLSGQHELERAMAQIEAEEARKRAAAAEEAKRAEQLKREQDARRAEDARWAEETRRADEARRAEEQRRAEGTPAQRVREPTPSEKIGTAAAPAVFSPRSGTSPGNRPSSQGIPAAGRAPTSPGAIPGARPLTSPGVVPSPRGPTSPGSAPAADRPLMTEEAKRRAKELLTRRLDAGRSQPSAAKPSTPPPPPPPVTKEGMIRDLATSLMGAATLTGGLDPVQRHVAEARRELAEGQTVEAVRRLRLAVALAPDDHEIKALHDKVALDLAASLADNYAEQAAYEERHQKWAAAAISWQKVVEGRPHDPDCHWRGAKALLESGGDLKQAVRLAQRAVELAPSNVFAVRVLGRAFMGAGMALNAKRELERAVALDPRDETTKALLKELKSG